MRKYLVGMWDAACPHEQAEDALPMGSLPAPWEHPARPRGAPHGLGTAGGRWLWVQRGIRGGCARGRGRTEAGSGCGMGHVTPARSADAARPAARGSVPVVQRRSSPRSSWLLRHLPARPDKWLPRIQGGLGGWLQALRAFSMRRPCDALITHGAASQLAKTP